MTEYVESTPVSEELPDNWYERSTVFLNAYGSLCESLSQMAIIDLRLEGYDVEHSFDCDIFPCMTNDEEFPERYIMVCKIDGRTQMLSYPMFPSKQ